MHLPSARFRMRSLQGNRFAIGAPEFMAGDLHDLRAGRHRSARTIILEHAPAPGVKFHTLYGHLNRESLKGLKPGAAFMAGERIAGLGTKRENGGWPPHLHFQLILDIGSATGDYPGVCKRSERDRWLSICPDPRPLLGVAVA